MPSRIGIESSYIYLLSPDAMQHLNKSRFGLEQERLAPVILVLGLQVVDVVAGIGFVLTYDSSKTPCRPRNLGVRRRLQPGSSARGWR
jgi:hypothetical protein